MDIGQVSDWVFNVNIGEFEDYEIYWTENGRLKDVYPSRNPYKYTTNDVAALEKNFIWDSRLRMKVINQDKEIKQLKKDNEMLKEQMSQVLERLNELEKCHCFKFEPEYGMK